MVMSEVSLCRIEELLLGIALQLRPTLAKGGPAVPSVDSSHSPRPRPGSRRIEKRCAARDWWPWPPVATVM